MDGTGIPGQRRHTATIVSVNTSGGSELPAVGATGIDKRPVPGAVEVAELGLAGDVQVDARNHGGADKAVYAYAFESLAAWEAQLGRSLWPGAFGENLTTVGLDVDGALVGETWRVGTALLEVRGPRIPCRKLSVHLERPELQREFLAARRPGAYLAVVRPGTVTAGDAVEVVWRPSGAPSVAEVFAARTGGRRTSALRAMPSQRVLDVPVSAAR
ncbi:MOSC domain-containing protein YiiM [Motilibacter rhizosphaerae]|uniref:MOSC domain-containing protein YiiM n=1 Tax=Motilibacter rhizosphaerae TaxID=598652 RepID=A0A4Q7NRX4_9ACTN|nr:MOSC domain-containing protein [Motilibacter rhizosphaerae]RZS89745.1 MOSC domain-containing protein YiiM [Motilibacter rhizosphaerae]